MKKLLLLFCCVFMLMSPVTAHASSLDDLGGETQTNTEEASSEQQDGNGSPLTDYMQGYNPITDDSMEQATKWSAPMVKFIGTATSFIILITVSLMFLITALDVLYISFPPVRGLLNPEQGQAPAQGGGMMGGMGGYGMRGGMGMGAMGGMGSQGGQATAKPRWISDEAVAAYQLTQPQPQGGGMGMMGGMGMGAMGGMGAQQSEPVSTKSAIFIYLKKRMFFMVVFGVTTVVLFSSALMGFGANIGEFILTLFGKLTGNL